MAVTENFETTDDLIEFLEHLTGERNPSQLTSAMFRRYLNQAHKEVINGGGILNTTAAGGQKTAARQWSWLPVTDEVVTLAPLETGTITVVNGSATATLDSSPTDSKADWFLQFDGAIYKITAHTGSTATVTLDSTCASASGDYSYTLYKLHYTLSTTNVIRMFDDPVRLQPSPKQLSVVSEDAISDRDLYRLPERRLADRIAVDFDTDDTPRIMLSSISDKTQRVRFKFVTEPVDLDGAGNDPILPKRHRKLLAHLAAFYHLEKRDDSRAQGQLQIARMLFGAMVDEQDRKLTQQGKEFFGKPRLKQTRTWGGGRFNWLRSRG